MQTSIEEDSGVEKSDNLIGQGEYKALKRQHLVFIMVLSLLVVVFFWHYFQDQIFVGNDLTIDAKVAVSSPLIINPNTATWEELSLLPGIGPAKAKDIVKFRQQFQTSPNSQTFQSAEDLTRITGIGPKTAEAMKPYLIFK